jgi:predicted aspartyl protease
MADYSAQHLIYAPLRRVAAFAVTSVAALLPLISCVPPKPLMVTAPPAVEADLPDAHNAPHPSVRFYDTYWHALWDDNLQVAWIMAQSNEQRRLSDAIEAFFNGNNDEADSIVVKLLSAHDRDVRDAARVTYGAILTAKGDWAHLAAYADSARRDRRDAAGVETWAPAFKGIQTRVSFDDSVTSVPLTRSMTGVAIIPVVVNGVKRRFWLDTGSSITILTSEVASASRVAGIGGDTLELVSSVGRLATRAAVVGSLQLGGVTITNAPAMIVSNEALEVREASTGMPPQPIDGVIGFDLIRSLDLTIDDARSRVIIRKPAARSVPRNLAWFGVPIVTMLTEGGTAVHMLLDTGAEETFGTGNLARKSNARWREAERRTVQGFGGAKTESGIVIPRVRLFLGDVPLSFDRIFLYDANYPTIFTLDGTLGSDIGRGGRVRIDMTNGRLDISSN